MADKEDKKIIVYSAVWCPFCHVAMQYFEKLGYKYEERDVEKKVEWMKESVDKSGQTGIPVIEIDKKIIIGFNRPQIDAALAA